MAFAQIRYFHLNKWKYSIISFIFGCLFLLAARIFLSPSSFFYSLCAVLFFFILLADLIRIILDQVRSSSSELQDSIHRFERLFEFSPHPHLILNEIGIADCNFAAVNSLWCIDKNDLLSRHPALFSPEFQPDGRRSEEKFKEMDALAWKKGHHEFEWVYRKMDGTLFLVQTTVIPIRFKNKKSLLILLRDLTAVKVAEEERNYLVFELRQLLESIYRSAIVVITDREGKILQVNQAFCEASGYESHELIGENYRIVNSGKHHQEFFRDLWDAISSGKTWTGDIHNKKKNGDSFWIHTVISSLSSEVGEIDRYLSIGFDVTSRVRMEVDLQRAIEIAENANQAKLRFLANMNHEMRTPLNGILGITDLLLSSTLDFSSMDQLKIIRNCSTSLLNLVNDVLDFSNLEINTTKREFQPFSIQSVVQELVELLKFRAFENGLELTYSHDNSIPNSVIGDPTGLRQILMNLILNSIKFTENGKIELSSQAIPLDDNKWNIHFEVKDTGIGISDEVKNKLFIPFSQVDSSTTRSYGGSGLGLAICKRLCERMSGTIWVDSTPGIGSTFSFTFQVKENLFSFVQVSVDPLAVFDSEMGKKNPIRILVAEDNSINQLVLLGILKKLGYSAEVASNGKEVLSYLERQSFDLILMDCHMPVMDGFEATKQVLSQYRNLDRPRIVAVTASTLQEDIERCYNVGMDSIIGKPITIPMVVNVLNECYQKKSELFQILQRCR